MRNFKLRTYSVRHETPENALFILSRGKNAGRPMFEPCKNCYILYCRDQVELENLYWGNLYTLEKCFFPSVSLRKCYTDVTDFEFHQILKHSIMPKQEPLKIGEAHCFQSSPQLISGACF